MAENLDMLREQLAELQKKYKEIEETNQNLNERLLELYSLYQISLTLSSTLDFDEILRSFKKLFQKTFDVDQFSLMLFDNALDALEIKSYFGLGKNLVYQTRFRFGEDIFGQAVEKGELIYVPDMSLEPRYSYHPGNKKYGSFLSLPLMPEKNQPIGVLNLQRYKTHAFTERELSLLSRVGDQIAKVIDKTLLFKHTKELSVTDELTGVYNRRYFNQRYDREFQRAKRYKRPLTILMIDIDYFKNYNDINGHIMGDEVLKEVAFLLDSNIRKADILARFGGEEFVILLPEIDKPHSLKVAEKLRKTIEQNHFEGEHRQPNRKITISLGLATFPEDAIEPQKLLDLADKSLYTAKSLGRNRIGHYPPEEEQAFDTKAVKMKVAMGKDNL